MTEEKAQFILSEIKNINRYDKIIRDLSLEIQNLLFEIESMQLPKCPTGYPKIAPTVSPSDPTSKVLELMGDESNLRKERGGKYEVKILDDWKVAKAIKTGSTLRRR